MKGFNIKNKLSEYKSSVEVTILTSDASCEIKIEEEITFEFEKLQMKNTLLQNELEQTNNLLRIYRDMTP